VPTAQPKRRGRPSSKLTADHPYYPLLNVLNQILLECGIYMNKLAADLVGANSRLIDRMWRNETYPPLDVMEDLFAWSRTLPIWRDERRIDLDLRRADIEVRLTQNKRPTMRVQRNELKGIVGVGGLNYDHIVPVSLQRTAGDQRTFQIATYSREPETITTHSDIRERLAALELAHPSVGMLDLPTDLGGWAYNVVRILSDESLGCRTGFSRTHGQVLEELGCDCEFLQSVDEDGGWCISIMTSVSETDVARRMRTSPGANRLLYEQLLVNFWSLLAYLRSSRVVHVSSLFDEQSPEVLATLLEAVASSSPATVISFDPGDVWSRGERSCDRNAVERILAVCNILFVNEDELRSIGHRYCSKLATEEAEKDVAEGVLAELLKRRDASLIVVKHRGATTIYAAGADPRHIELTTRLSANQIEDDTGAGDVFAAGFLAAQASDAARLQVGAGLGMELARVKLSRTGRPEGEVLAGLIRRTGDWKIT
jgi:sugar/nucleoside kinase (ribokinase family)